MFFHSMKYMFLTLMRSKSFLFWCFAFPLVLGTMFHFAFAGLGSDESFEAIPIAVVIEEDASSFELIPPDIAAGFPESFASTDSFSPESLIRGLFDSLSEPGDDQFLEVTYASWEEACALLEEKKIYGIITADLSALSDSINTRIAAVSAGTETAADFSVTAALLHLSVSAEMRSDPLYQSILSAFVEQFNLEYNTILTAAMTHPDALPGLLDTFSDNMDTSYLTQESTSADTLDESLIYFFNLIAMTCLYAAMAGNNVAIYNQANLSWLGARRNISPVPKLVSILGQLAASLIFEFLTLIVTLAYLVLVLGVSFGSELGYVALTALCGCFAGISLGFFVGSFGQLNEITKFAILMVVIMAGCFLSGLMVSDMRIRVENFCPLINRINPSALITDALYALIVYPSHARFFSNIISLLALSILLCLGGFALVRRKKYASL